MARGEGAGRGPRNLPDLPETCPYSLPVIMNPIEQLHIAARPLGDVERLIEPTDDDCESVATYTCCGPGTIIGLAKTAESVIPSCFTTSYPQNCPPLGCASQATTEDGQPLGTADPSSVIARCFETAPGEKGCMTTVRGSCVHNVTRCAAGETCTNECRQACSCQNGYQVCTRPTNGTACPAPPMYCPYLTAPGGSTSSICSCTATSPTWTCGA
jgi:hypothetical protein